jgi:hypothetical protein
MKATDEPEENADASFFRFAFFGDQSACRAASVDVSFTWEFRPVGLGLGLRLARTLPPTSSDAGDQ